MKVNISDNYHVEHCLFHIMDYSGVFFTMWFELIGNFYCKGHLHEVIRMIRVK
jgi:hypothetical protein